MEIDTQDDLKNWTCRFDFDCSTMTGRVVSTEMFAEQSLTGTIIKYQRNCNGLPFCIYEKGDAESCTFHDIGLVCESKIIMFRFLEVILHS